MCRNIQPLFNFEPPASEEEVRAAALQYIRKISGYNQPSKINENAFLRAVEVVTEATSALLASLETSAPPRDRAEAAARRKARSALRFSSPNSPLSMNQKQKPNPKGSL